MEQEYKVQVTILIKARNQEEALDEFEKRVGRGDYTGEDVTIETI
jgi:hypothetical protein